MNPILDRITAERLWAEGIPIYAVHEMDEEPALVTSLEMLIAYAPDHLFTA